MKGDDLMAIEVFNRYENKYMLDEITFKRVTSELKKYMVCDKYNESGNPYEFANIYYDTEEHFLIKESLQKPKYKEKLRLRAYGVPNEETLVYAEIKKKFNGLVNKRRTSLLLPDAYEFLESKSVDVDKPYINQQVINEIDFMLNRYDLYPSMYIAYDRWAYFNREDKDLRISFDTNIRYRETELALEAGNHGKSILEEGHYLMEIKCSKNIPFWLSQLLTEMSLFPVSFSKYGMAYKLQMQSKYNLALSA